MIMWADYYHERLGGEVILKEGVGFCAYRVSGEEIYLEEMYIDPKHRNAREASELADMVMDIGKERGCKTMTATVDLRTLTARDGLFATLGYGFKPVSAHNNVVCFAKEIE